MTEQMYHDYRVKQLVDETIKSALKTASSMESDRITVIENPNRSEVEELDDIIVDDYTFSDNSEDGNTTDSGLQLEGIVVQNCFIYILSKYKHLRPIWQFGKKIEDNEENWTLALYEDFYFRHHCASIQAGLTMIMENKDDPESIKKLLNEIGAHHFFYDACEPHLELLDQVKGHVSDGIAIQRNTYMKQCMTLTEMEDIRAKWEKVTEFGLLEAGEILCETAFKIYTNLLSRHHLRMPIPELQRENENFSQFAEFTIMVCPVLF
uniref:GLOBIN domain-containing protein n=1 Tax=Heterorhabditis bacteriophora TaxID=37862 RepID=A0A1I7XNU2_HETBA